LIGSKIAAAKMTLYYSPVPMRFLEMKKIFPVSFLLVFLPILLTAQLHCDSTLVPINDFLLRYKARVTRCEGFYKPQARASGLRMVSLTYGEFRYQADLMEVIQVSLPAHMGAQAVHLRAQGIPADVYYQMDATLSGAQTLDWPVQYVLLKDPRTHLNRNVGLLGYWETGQGRTYVPLLTHTKLSLADEFLSPVIRLIHDAKLAQVQWKWENQKEFTVVAGPFRMGVALSFRLGTEKKLTLLGKTETLIIRYLQEGKTEWEEMKVAVYR
jgi:hypothetical protein